MTSGLRASAGSARRLVATLFCCGLSAAAQAAPLPPSAFGRTPAIANVDLSPNGNFAAWSESSETGDVVVMFDLVNKRQLRAFNVGDYIKLRDLSWADDETLLITVSRTVLPAYGLNRRPMEYWRTQAVDIAGESGRTLLMQQGDMELVSAAEMIALHPARPKTVIMASYDYAEALAAPAMGSRVDRGRRGSGWIYNLYEVDTRTGKGSKLATGNNFTQDWVVDRAGLPVARSEWVADKSLFRILAKDGGSWREIYQQVDGESLALTGLTEDGLSIVALGARGEPRALLWAIPLDGSAPRVLFSDPDVDVVSVTTDRFTGAPAAVRLGGANSPTQWLNAAAENRSKALARAFPGRQVRTWGSSVDGKRVLAHVSGPSEPPVYYLVDFGTRKADIVGEEYPELAGQALGPVQGISYKARDGYDVPAYLTLPPGAAPANLPLVVLPHGGPEGRDEAEFGWWPQFLASRGYAVLQPQFRGSTGFGEAHRLAGVRQWGKRMQDDVTDGVKALIERKIADPRRICIVGASYGGYAALAGAAFTPELYACAASINGVSDLPMMLGSVQTRAGKESDVLGYWEHHIGDARDPEVVARSPAGSVAAIRAPILLLHGTDDTVVPIAQSELIDRRLTDLKKPHRFVRLTGEDHWLSRGATRIRMLTELDAFLAEHLQAPAAP